MTDTPNIPDTAVKAPEGHADGLSTPAGGGDTADGSSGAQGDAERPVPREQRYRLERNAARDALAAAVSRIERLQRAEVERLAAGALSHPADLFSLSGNGVADYLTADGDVDAGRVAADVAAVLAERPGLGKAPKGFDPSQGLGGAAPKPQLSWETVLTG